MRKGSKLSKSKSNKNKPIYFYSQSRLYKEFNGKVIENITTEQKNNILSIKGIRNGKKINKTKKLKN
jgi:hypothetical protein